jgi:Tfp pilus assembly protein PilF
LQKDTGNVDAMLQLSDLYIKTGDKKSAKKMVTEVLEIDPSNKEAAERLKKLD